MGVFILVFVDTGDLDFKRVLDFADVKMIFDYMAFVEKMGVFYGRAILFISSGLFHLDALNLPT